MRGLLGFACLGTLLGAASIAHGGVSPGLIVFASTRSGDGVLAVRSDGTHLTRLVAFGKDPRLSPDGKHLAFAGSDFACTVLDIGSQVRRRLEGGDQIGLGWSWSSDSSQLAVGADDGVHLYKADGTLERVLPGSDAGDPSWSPDGTQVVYSDSNSDIFIVPADAQGTPRQLVADGHHPLWSPDGREIAFDRYIGPKFVTFVVPAAGGAPRRIANGLFSAWSPDSTTLAVADDGDHGLSLYRRDGALQRALLSHQHVEDPVWSPDGKTVVATVDGDLWLFARDGSSRRQLTQGQRNGYKNSAPSWGMASAAVAGVQVSAATRYRGPLLAVSQRTGALVAGFPKVTGRSPDVDSNGPEVFSVASDGRGGWYIGGDFGFVGGVACPNLAHVDRTFHVDRGWCPRPDAAVRALIRVGGTLFVGGDMQHVGGARRAALAAFSVANGRLTRWAPQVAGRIASVEELAADPAGRRIYFGGEFARVGGALRSDLAAVDADSGAVTPFAPNPDRTVHDDGLVSFAVTAARVYASGYFEHIGGEPVRSGLATLDPNSGKVVSWKPGCSCIVSSLVVAGNRVFAAGVGGRIGGVVRDSLASFTGNSEAVDAWAPRTAGLYADRVAPAGAAVIAALGKTSGNSPHRLAAYSASSGRILWLSPLAFDGDIQALASDGRVVVAGGNFTSVH